MNKSTSLSESPEKTKTVKTVILPSLEKSDMFKDLVIIKSLCHDASFPVYLTFSNKDFQYYAIKLYPYHEEEVSPFFYRESYLTNLTHPGIISVKETILKKTAFWDKKPVNFSTVVMEVAPHGDLLDLVSRGKFGDDDVLIRTYFHQLIDAIEYLHGEGVSHMNLKLENLLIGKDYCIKIGDFKRCQKEKDDELGRGSKNYRAPEIRARKCYKPQASDIFSVGVILYLWKFGIFPFVEKSTYGKPVNLKADNFWDQYYDVQNKLAAYDDGFNEMFNSMVRLRPEFRANIEEIKRSKWYHGPLYSMTKLQTIMSTKIEKLNQTDG
jgi:serine/threonine protein kinase